MSERPTKRDCAGCENDFYNGHNPYDVKECWSLKKAEWATKLPIPVDVPPPYSHIKAKRVPNCYHVKRMVYVKPEALTPDRKQWA